jgi:hypothetical protein
MPFSVSALSVMILDRASAGLRTRCKAPFHACRTHYAAPADESRPIPSAGDHLRRSVVYSNDRINSPVLYL